MVRTRKLSRLAIIGTTVASAALVLAACGSSTPSGGASTTTTPAGHGMVKVKGGTMTIAESPAAGPNYIFPMMGSSYFTTQNYQLIYLLYRPLYWFGVGNTPSLNEALSFGELPVYSNGGRVVTIKMKGWKWSNGETVDAQDIVFWMNLLKADATSWAAYVPGPTQFPGNVTNVVANNSTDTVTFRLDTGLQPVVVHGQRAEPDHASSDRMGHHLRGCGRGFGRLFEGELRVDNDHAQDRQRRVDARSNLGVRKGLHEGARVPDKQYRGGRSWHVRKQPALADRERAVQADPVRCDRQRRHPCAEHLLLGISEANN